MVCIFKKGLFHAMRYVFRVYSLINMKFGLSENFQSFFVAVKNISPYVQGNGGELIPLLLAPALDLPLFSLTLHELPVCTLTTRLS